MANNLAAVEVAGRPIKVVGFADEIALVTSKDAVQAIFELYKKFSHASRLYLNASKTEILDLCKWPQNSSSRLKDNGFDFELDHKSEFTVTGNFIALDQEIRYSRNVKEKIEKDRSVFKQVEVQELDAKWSYVNSLNFWLITSSICYPE